MDIDLPMVRTVIGWCAHEQSERAVPSRTLLPVSPLKEMLQQQPQSRSLPRLRIKTRPAAEVETGGTSVPLRCRTASSEECSSSIHTSSPPISIPYACARLHGAMNVEGQILEDLSINPEAYHTRLPSSIVGAPHSIGASCDMDCAASHSSTVAEAQLQGLLAHAKQGQDGLHMVSVVEAMLYAAEEHDRLLLDCEHERLHHPEDCMFDIDLPAAVFCQ